MRPSHNSSTSLKKFAKIYNDFDKLSYDTPDVVKLETIKEAFITFTKQLHQYFPTIVLKKLGEICVAIGSLDSKVKFSVKDQTIYQSTDDCEPDLIISA